MGLIEADVLLSDRDPLHIALSVSLKDFEADKKEIASEAEWPGPPRPADRPQVSDLSSYEGNPAVTGPTGQQREAQRARESVQGLEAKEPIRIVFDGGSRGNPGQGYGSYALDWPGNPREVERLTFGDQATNNEAEYDTLIAALEDVRDRVADLKIDPRLATLSIWGDSLLVCNQVRGKWACKEPRLQARLKRVKDLLSSFGESQLHHHPRDKSVDILGH